jgi:hypothetical protein
MMTLSQLRLLVPFILPVLGCILIAVAAFLVHPALGFLVSGVAAFFTEWRIDAERSRG